MSQLSPLIDKPVTPPVSSEALTDERRWWLYMIRTVSGKLYTGITTDVERRFAEHLGGSAKAAKFFRSDAAKAVVYREVCDNRSQASKREAAIKKMRRADKLKLIQASSNCD